MCVGVHAGLWALGYSNCIPYHCPNALSYTAVSGADIMPLVRDALDSLEFISGPADSTWGSLRAAMGHPEPWAIKYMAIGNEVGGAVILRYC